MTGEDKRILYTNYDGYLAKTLSKILAARMQNFRVDSASTIEQAGELVKQNLYSAALLDLELPFSSNFILQSHRSIEMGDLALVRQGLRFAKELKQLQLDTRIILTSVQYSEEIEAAARESSMRLEDISKSYLQKPFLLDDLISIIENNYPTHHN